MSEHAIPSEIDDLGASLGDAWDKSTGVVDDSPSPEPAAEAPAQDQQPLEERPADTRARDEGGRFTKAQVAANAKAAAAAGAQPATEFKIPEKWPADVRAKLEAIHKVNPEHAEFVLQQFDHFRRVAAQNQQYQDSRAGKLLGMQKQVEDLLAPGRQARAMRGIDDNTYVRNLVAAGDYLDKSPVDGLKYLAKQYGIDLSKLDQPGGGEPEIPPAIQQLQRENAEIKAYFREQAVGQQQAHFNEALSWIDRFAGQTDGKGQPLYPYFDEVLPEIQIIVQHQRQHGHQVDVHAAYTSAIRMNDSVWLKDQKRNADASRIEADTKRKRDIEDAKRAGLSVGGSGAGTVDAPPDDLGEALARNYDRSTS